MGRMLLLLWVATTLVAVCGCQHYEFRVIKPTAAAHSLGKEPITIPQEPLEYRLSKPNHHVAMRIINPTDDPVTLLSAKSYVVDPAVETHPLRGRTIAPHSYVGIFLPPLPRVYSTGPYGGIGPGFGYDPFFVSARFGAPYYPYSGFYDPFFYTPLVPSYQVITPYDWQWKEGQARVRLEYERTGKNFVHDFIFEKRRMK